MSISKLLSLSFLTLLTMTAFAQDNPNEATRSGAIECLGPFYHGVASGDPLTDRVILWTRVTTDSASVDVTWRIATDTAMSNIVNSGIVTTNDNKDYTVKIDATGLQPYTWYYYEFEAYGLRSVRGRTRTLPVGDIDSLRFAVVSCQDYANGYYNAYARLAERNDLFAIIHLGDYIYEYGGGTAPRDNVPPYEILNISDYRIRHSQYKLDEDLRAAHQQYPFFAVWDDHETANNSWFGGAENHTPGTEGDWFDRKAAGVQAYYEWMPLRMPDMQDTQRIYRKFRLGELMDLYMMDTRLQGREEQDGHNTSTTRTLLGQQQRDWFLNSTDTSTARWQVMGQQVMFAPLRVQISPFPAYYPNDDQWDGYPAERNTIQNHILTNNIPNFVVLTGDIHTSWANDIPSTAYNSSTGAGSVGVEFVATSITSQGSPLPVSQSIIQSQNPHMKYIDLTRHGYVLLDVNKDRTQGEFWYVSTISSRGGTEAYAQAFFVNNGERHLRTASGPSLSSSHIGGIKAPLDPRCTLSSISISDKRESVLLGVYPNPFNNDVMMQFTLHTDAESSAIVFDALGREVARKNFGKLNAGMHELSIDLSRLNAGAYIIVLKMGDKINQRKLVKTN
jgi:alkaline phosphatase D